MALRSTCLASASTTFGVAKRFPSSWDWASGWLWRPLPRSPSFLLPLLLLALLLLASGWATGHWGWGVGARGFWSRAWVSVGAALVVVERVEEEPVTLLRAPL